MMQRERYTLNLSSSVRRGSISSHCTTPRKASTMSSNIFSRAEELQHQIDAKITHHREKISQLDAQRNSLACRCYQIWLEPIQTCAN